jgi:hypothetical protein
VTRLLIVGPPGAGKGTQATRISDEFGIPDVSTGDIFRQNIKDRTELGQQVQALVDAGNYVPDELTNRLVTARLQEVQREVHLPQGFEAHFARRLVCTVCVHGRQRLRPGDRIAPQIVSMETGRARDRQASAVSSVSADGAK